jgi:putative hydrolase of the HAD superfamily
LIKALIFDFGGVLTNPVWESFAAFCTEEGIDAETIRTAFREDPDALADLRRLETGEMEEREFERRFAERLGLESSDDLIERLFKGMVPEQQMLDAVRAARAAGLKTALLSNSWSVSHYDREMLDELFDVSVISGEVGMHKPQPEIYELAIDRLGVEPSECAFIDDLAENCDGAEAVGMTAVRHRHPAETLGRLTELTNLTLN